MSETLDPIESKKFYELMQTYRHTPAWEASSVMEAYENVKAHITTKLMEAYQAGQDSIGSRDPELGITRFDSGFDTWAKKPSP